MVEVPSLTTVGSVLSPDPPEAPSVHPGRRLGLLGPVGDRGEGHHGDAAALMDSSAPGARELALGVPGSASRRLLHCSPVAPDRPSATGECRITNRAG